ncbi:PB1 domain-containing protein [Roseiconus lacunae]|uniref:Uncharacterized protein n=1 Tax=Roseiconus lacunae TaxID=2605694 RepID=A0ABT7PQW7_9BACT|nr:hypothetical protein [Roseiconus lacunae]MCD0463451.1 hypothetical protein [Roseiconus lacunae]MDM4018731.1 hypothetical protein [Roseiconus lacunae]WRQ48574.1 hypothetical protein U8335_16550 [Stieleria sp. HD01]
MIKRLIKRVLLVGFTLIAALALSAWWGYHQSKKVPDFYRNAIQSSKVSAEEVAESSEQMQAQVEQLQADVEQVGLWEAVFAEEQINAWLIDQLPQHFQKLQAKGLQDPQIKVDEGNVTAAARIKSRRFDGVVSCNLSIQMTDQPNCLAIKLNSIYAGALPLPLAGLKDNIAKIFAKTSLNLRWDDQDGETVALIDIPQKYSGMEAAPVIVEFIELNDGKVCLAGRSGEGTLADFEPRGAVYEIASLKNRPEASLDYPRRSVHGGGAGSDETISLD